MILKNEIPILEYDDSSKEVIAPDHDCEELKLPEKCLFAFLGDVVHTYAESSCAEVVLELITVSQTIKIYVLHEGNEDICLVQSPIGAAAAAQVLDTLVTCGVKKVIAKCFHCAYQSASRGRYFLSLFAGFPLYRA